MISRRLPNSTPSVLRVLQTAHDTYLNTPVATDRAITAEQFAFLDLDDNTSFLSRFKKEISEADHALAAQAPLTSGLAISAARLTLFASHFHQVLDLGIARGAFALGARPFYGRDITVGSLPDLSSYAAVAETAGKIVSGETARQTAEGAAFLPMALPSATEVATQLGLFTTARDASQTALVKTDKEREDVAALYPAAQELAVDLCDTVEFFYRKDREASSRRSKSARWGVVYISDTGEAVPTTTPPATPTPPVITP